jgi:hypothetical protein
MRMYVVWESNMKLSCMVFTNPYILQLAFNSNVAINETVRE